MKKTNHNRYIIIFFLCILSLTADARQITLHDLPGEYMEKINKVDDMVQAVFKLKKRSRSRTVLQISAEKRPAPKLDLKNNRMTLKLVSGNDLLGNPENYQALVSGLLLSSGALDCSDDPERAVPRWICAALCDRQYSFLHAERFLKGLKNISAAEIMFSSGYLPDLSLIPLLPEKLENEAAFWYGQFCRLLLETAIEQKLLQPFGSRLLQTQSYEEEHAQLLKSLATVLFKEDPVSSSFAVNKVLWNSYHPEPAEYKSKKWQALLTWQIAELDKQGKTTDRKKSLPLADLHLHLKNHPDAAEHRKQASEKIRMFRIGCTFTESSLLHKIYLMLKTPAEKDSEERTLKLNRLIENLSALFQKRKQLEQFLYSAEHVYTSVTRTYQKTLAADSGKGNVSDEQIRFLLDTEKIYSD